MTEAMEYAIEETNRRRKIQEAHNEKYGIIPQTIKKDIRDVIRATEEVDEDTKFEQATSIKDMTREQKESLIIDLETQMRKAASELDFETAASLRDVLFELKASL